MKMRPERPPCPERPWCPQRPQCPERSEHLELPENPESADSQDSRFRGFSLIELLAVIAVIAILSGIVFAVGGGVAKNRQNNVARGELAALSVALESFKTRYGDYPWVNDDPEALFEALAGELVLRDNGSGYDMRAPASGDAPALADLAAFQLNADGDEIVDPWGNPYHYYYFDGTGDRSSWTYPGYILLSAGEDGELVDSAGTGTVSSGDLPNNAADYYTGTNEDNLVLGLQNPNL